MLKLKVPNFGGCYQIAQLETLIALSNGDNNKCWVKIKILQFPSGRCDNFLSKTAEIYFFLKKVSYGIVSLPLQIWDKVKSARLSLLPKQLEESCASLQENLILVYKNWQGGRERCMCAKEL